MFLHLTGSNLDTKLYMGILPPMTITDLGNNEKEVYNSVVSHPLQSFEWGEFRQRTGVWVIRKIIKDNKKAVDAFSLTIHKIPYTPWTIGYLPKGNMPQEYVLKELARIGQEYRCIFIQLEPNVEIKTQESIKELVKSSAFKVQSSFHPLFTKYTFVLDLTKTEEELLESMHPKTRYNIKIAKKHGVTIVEDNSENAFREYLRLTDETTKRQQFYAHSLEYHTLMWKTLRATNNKQQTTRDTGLRSHLLVARYKEKILTTWILFIFHDTLYYPYGASSSEYKETMASNLMMWEAIRFGKQKKLKKFDMWGSLGPDVKISDPWYGFHRFKQGYGPELVEFVGSFDLAINPFLYEVYKILDKVRWLYLKLRR